MFIFHPAATLDIILKNKKKLKISEEIETRRHVDRVFLFIYGIHHRLLSTERNEKFE